MVESIYIVLFSCIAIALIIFSFSFLSQVGKDKAFLVICVCLTIELIIQHGFLDHDLPLHLCQIMKIFTIFTLLTKSQLGYELTFLVGQVGGLISILAGIHPPNHQILHATFFLTGHVLLSACPILLTLYFGMRPRRNAQIKTAVLLFLYTLFLGGFNEIYGTNYMFLGRHDYIRIPWPFYVFLLGPAISMIGYFCSRIELGVISKVRIKASSIYPPFMESFKRYGKSDVVFQALYPIKGNHPEREQRRQSLEIYERRYEENKTHFNLSLETPERIPKTVHQIWLGSEVSEKYREWMQSWKMQGWTYKLWTDKEVQNFPLYNRELYDQTENYGAKSDILRYEILTKEGGLYVDVDFACVKPAVLDSFHKAYDLFVGMEPIEHTSIHPSPRLGNALIGSIPNHPILKKMILDLKEHYQQNSEKDVITRTGPHYLTLKVLEHEKIEPSSLRNLYLPPPFFFPISGPESRKWSKKKQDKEIGKFKENVAIHYWTGSWNTDKKRGK